MKTRRASFIAALAGAGIILFGATTPGPAQLRSGPAETDSVVAIVADAQGLPLVPRDQVPWFGTFWVVRNSVPTIIAPLPCPPLNQSYPIYAIGSRQFLVDETGGPLVVLRSAATPLTSADYAAIVQKQVDDLLNHVASIQEAELNTELMALESEGPPLPPGSEGGEGGGGTLSLGSSVYGTNDLWIEITGTSETELSLVVHGTLLDEAYSLQSKTNLQDSGWIFEGETFLGLADETPQDAAHRRPDQQLVSARTMPFHRQ